MPKLDSRYSGPDRRRHARLPSDLPAQIVMARDTLVFCQTRDLSEGGTCLKRPTRFRVEIGERLVVAGGSSFGAGRNARVVGVSEALVHCAFVA
jgi:hypothetical protein